MKKKLLILCSILASVLCSIAQAPATALFHVKVVDNKEIPQAGEKVLFTNLSDKTEVSGVTDSNGVFDVTLIQNQEYEVMVLTFGKSDEPNLVKVPSATGRVEVNYKIITYYLGTFLLDVQFETGKSTLDASSFKVLDEFYDMLDQKKDMTVEIGGHTDNVGDDASNLTLSQNRANIVREYLIKKGIAPNRIIAKGYGETEPIASNDTPEGRQKNRRTEVKIVQE